MLRCSGIPPRTENSLPIKSLRVVTDGIGGNSFDHVAINDDVVACDIAHVPLDDETLDVAVFSHSLMGANFTDYAREARRTLKLDGHLHIYESTSRFRDRTALAEGLKTVGFALLVIEDVWRFTHIHAVKTERQAGEDIDLRL